MAQCMFPFYVQRKLYFRQQDRTVPVPCGSCPECLKRRVHSWAFRLEKESEHWISQYFLTLTYDDKYLTETPNGYYTLVKRELQLFFKRLRKQTGGQFKYYACGEYGSEFQRPHYHVILYGDQSITAEAILLSWVFVHDIHVDIDTGNTFHPSIGHVHFGDVQDASVKYTIQYYDKGRLDRLQDDDDRQEEFAVMSKGIGKSWLNNETAKFIRSRPESQFVYTSGGYKIAIPSYYRRRIYDYLGTETLVREHPSYVAEMADREYEKKQRQIITQRIQDEKEQPDLSSSELHEDRKAAIDNYRRQHRKARS